MSSVLCSIQNASSAAKSARANSALVARAITIPKIDMRNILASTPIPPLPPASAFAVGSLSDAANPQVNRPIKKSYADREQ
jgi:hypothetical protein